MNSKKSWILILLLAFSLNVMHGFFTHHNSEGLHHHNSHITHALEHHDSCKCLCFHLNFMLTFTQETLPQLRTLKPSFEHLVTNSLEDKLTLDKPPTT